MICPRCGADWELPVPVQVLDADPGGGIPRWGCQCGQEIPWRVRWGREHRADSLYRAKVN